MKKIKIIGGIAASVIALGAITFVGIASDRDSVKETAQQDVWYTYVGDQESAPNSQYADQIADPEFYQNTGLSTSPSCPGSAQICAIKLPDSGTDHPDAGFTDILDDIESETETAQVSLRN